MSWQAEDIEHDLTVKELLQMILIELRILNKYNELGHDEIIDEESVHEDRRR
tara:strand:+ start:439 stop:594 length:156 start_codon:yes stop_codon:yes gene_type:complete